jgi:hypothetical protein
MSVELIEDNPTSSHSGNMQSSSQSGNSQNADKQNIDEKLQVLEKKYVKNVELVNEKKNLINKLNEELVKIQNDTLLSLIELSNMKENYLVSLVKAQSERLKDLGK